MDRRLHLIDHLYGEDSSETPPLSDLLSDPELNAEYRALSEARFALDRRPRHRPDRSVVDAIVAEAAPKELPSRSRPWGDRAPLALVRKYRRMSVSAVAMAAMLAVALWMQPWSEQGEAYLSPMAADMEHALVPPESLLRALPPAPSLTASRGLTSNAEWDEGRDIRQIARRIESLRAVGELDWSEPAVPLEMLPSDSRSATLPASDRR